MQPNSLHNNSNIYRVVHSKKYQVVLPKLCTPLLGTVYNKTHKKSQTVIVPKLLLKHQSIEDYKITSADLSKSISILNYKTNNTALITSLWSNVGSRLNNNEHLTEKEKTDYPIGIVRGVNHNKHFSEKQSPLALAQKAIRKRINYRKIITVPLITSYSKLLSHPDTGLPMLKCNSVDRTEDTLLKNNMISKAASTSRRKYQPTSKKWEEKESQSRRKNSAEHE